MTNKLLLYIQTVSNMDPITNEKVFNLSNKEYSVKASVRATAASVFLNTVMDNILNLNKTETKEALKIISILGSRFYNVLKSKDIFYTKIRKPILTKYGKESKEYKQALDLMKITSRERTKLNVDYNKKTRANNKDRKTFYSENLLDVIEETKDAEDWATQAVGLMLSSGTRPIELLDKNNFTPDPTSKKWVLVSGIAKKREDKQDVVVSRPIIGYTAIEFIKAVNNFRNKISNRKLYIETGSDKGQLKKSNVALIHSRIKHLFTDPDITPKTLRKLYGNLAHLLYGGTDNLNIFLSEILGHSDSDNQTSFSYSTLRIVKGNEKNNSDNYMS